MKTVIEHKEVSRPKITIAREEMRVKIPPHTDGAMIERITAFCEAVKSAEESQFKQTLRGKIHMDADGKLVVTLRADKKQVCVRSYREGSDGLT